MAGPSRQGRTPAKPIAAPASLTRFPPTSHWVFGHPVVQEPGERREDDEGHAEDEAEERVLARRSGLRDPPEPSS